MAKGLVLCSQHIILAIWIEFPPKEHRFSLLLPGKKSVQNAKKFLDMISAGGKNTSVLTLGGWGFKKKIPTRLAAVDYLDRKWCSESFFHPKMADFVLLVTLSSATFTDSYSVTPGLRLLVPKPKPTNQNDQWKVLTRQPKQENGHLPPYFDH